MKKISVGLPVLLLCAVYAFCVALPLFPDMLTRRVLMHTSDTCRVLPVIDDYRTRYRHVGSQL